MNRAGKRQRERERQQRRAERKAHAAGPAQAAQGGTTHPARGALAPALDLTRHWYLARTAPRLGPLGRKMLDEALKTGETHAHLPRASEVVVRRGRRVVRYTPLIVRTLIVGVKDDNHLASVQALPGIAEIVSYPEPEQGCTGNVAGIVNRPARLDPHALQAFLIALAAGEIVQPTGLKVGQSIVVVTGPFASFPAIVEEILANDRIRVEVAIFGTATSVVLGIADVQAV